MVPHSTVTILRTIQYLVQCLRETTVKIRTGLWKTQERRYIESVSSERRNCLTGVGGASSDFIHATTGRLRRKGTDINKYSGSHARSRKGRILRRSSTKLRPNHS